MSFIIILPTPAFEPVILTFAILLSPLTRKGEGGFHV
jgi:hypothetical protein